MFSLWSCLNWQLEPDHSFEFLSSSSWFFFNSICGLTLNNRFNISVLVGKLDGTICCFIQPLARKTESTHLGNVTDLRYAKPKRQVSPPLSSFSNPRAVADLSFSVRELVMIPHKGLMFWHQNILAQTHDAMSQWTPPANLLWKQTPGALRRCSEIHLECCHRFKTDILGLQWLQHYFPGGRPA